MMRRRILTVLAVCASAWGLALGTVAVVQFSRMVDVLETTAALPLASPAGFESVPVDWSSLDTRKLDDVASALDSIASAIRSSASSGHLSVSVYLEGTRGLEDALCEIAEAIHHASGLLSTC